MTRTLHIRDTVRRTRARVLRIQVERWIVQRPDITELIHEVSGARQTADDFLTNPEGRSDRKEWRSRLHFVRTAR
jgi:hypothetical protein